MCVIVLDNHMEEQTAELRRLKLQALVGEHFANIHDLVVETIQTATGSKVSVRSIQAWLISPNRTSSRNCPSWIIKTLQDYVEDPAKREDLATRVAARQIVDADLAKHPLAWSDKVRSEKAVEFATNEIEHDDRRLKHWQATLGLQNGKALFELERAMETERRALSHTVHCIHTAITSNTSFESFAESYRAQINGNDIARMFVRQARRAIEGKAEEFSNDDGLPAQL